MRAAVVRQKLPGAAAATRTAVPEYKRAEVGLIPSDWDSKSLGELASVIAGGTPDRSVPAFWNGDIAWITSSQIDFSTIRTADQFISAHGLRRSSAKLLRPGTLLIALYGHGHTRGKVAMLEVSAATNQACAAILPRDASLSRYLFYYLASLYESIRSLSNTGNQDNLSATIVRSIRVLVPPLFERRSIVAALSDADALIGNLDSLIGKKLTIEQAAMQQLLTGKTRLPGFSAKWETRRIRDVVRFLSTAHNSRADLNDNGDAQYIHYGDIHAHARPVLDCKATSLPLISRTQVGSAARLKDGDLVMVDASEDLEGIGKCVEVRGVAEKTVVAGLHTILCRGNPGHWATGFKAYLQFMPAFRSSLLRAATGISVFAVSKRQLGAVELALPSIAEQQAIVEVLSDMDAEIAALERRRDKTRAIKQGMMQALLTGRVRLVPVPIAAAPGAVP